MCIDTRVDSGLIFRDVRQKIHGTSYYSGYTRPEVQERHQGAQPRRPQSLVALWRLLWALHKSLICMVAPPPLCLSNMDLNQLYQSQAVQCPLLEEPFAPPSSPSSTKRGGRFKYLLKTTVFTQCGAISGMSRMCLVLFQYGTRQRRDLLATCTNTC